MQHAICITADAPAVTPGALYLTPTYQRGGVFRVRAVALLADGLVTCVVEMANQPKLNGWRTTRHASELTAVR